MKFFNYIKCKNSEEFIFKFVSLVSFFALAIFMIYIINNYEYIFPFSEGMNISSGSVSDTEGENTNISDIQHVSGPEGDHIKNEYKYKSIIRRISIAIDGDRDKIEDKLDEYRIKNAALIIELMQNGLHSTDNFWEISQRLLIEKAYQDNLLDYVMNYIPLPS